MPGVVIKWTLDGVKEATESLRTALDEQVEEALAKIATRIALAARVEHTFTNRTNRLENSLDVTGPRGTFSRGTLSAAVVARTYYASYLEDETGGERYYPGLDGEQLIAGKWSYLAAAWSAHGEEALPVLEEALQAALVQAGWH